MDIVEELRNNRESGAKRLEAEYKAGLMTLARRFCTDESDAAELVNRTFAAVVEGIDDYLEQSAFFAWMCQILTNIHSADIRRKSNRTVVYPGEVPDAADEEADEDIYRHLDHALLRDAIQSLPREMKEVIVMHYLMDEPVPKVAKFLCQPVTTVKWRLHCARKALAAKLGVAAKKPGVKALLIVLALAALTAVGAAGVAAIRAATTGNAECRMQNAECRDAFPAEGSSAANNSPTLQLANSSTPPLTHSSTHTLSQTAQGETMNATATTRTAAILASASLALTATGSEVRFLDTTGDHDLANAANWDPSSWTASDTLLVSTANATIPTTGLHLSTDMPASGAIKFGAFPNANVLVDFGGHSLNTEDLVFSQMHDDNNRFKYLLASGGFSGVKTIRLNESHKGHVRFTNGVFRVEKGVKMGNWYPYVHVCAGAELIVTKIVEDQVGMSGAQKGEFRINGGKFLVEARENANWRRSYWNGNLSTFMIENGGEYRDISPYSANSFRGIDVTIRDSGYYETNSFFIVRNTGFFDKAKYEITNSVFRVGQLYFGPYQVSGAYNNSDVSWYLYDSTVDFCDSEETFAFRWDQTKVSTGVIVPPSAQNNTILFRGGKNRFTSKTFVLGGSNTVAVTGGSFDVSNSFSFVEAQAGSGSRLILKDTDVYLASLSVSANAADALVEIAGTASVDVAQLTLASETTFKFVISGEGFAAAPIQFGSVSASGKARFAFDMADYDWPKKRANIPLVSHRGGFVGWEDGGLALDVGVLTEDHAGALPVNSKAGKCSFRLSADGKTLFLSVPGTAKGTMIVVN